MNSLTSKKFFILTAVVIIAIIGGAYWYVFSKTVYIDLSVIKAPIISLSPATSGRLEAVFVKGGDKVAANQPIARVGGEIIVSKTSGRIISVNQNIGEFENALSPQSVAATMIDPAQLRVVGSLDEDKGLSKIKIGDPVKFTVDTFGSKEYYGVVDEIGEASQASVASNIFSQRPTNQFKVYVRFNSEKYPELKDGMSARVWVFTKF